MSRIIGALDKMEALCRLFSSFPTIQGSHHNCSLRIQDYRFSQTDPSSNFDWNSTFNFVLLPFCISFSSSLKNTTGELEGGNSNELYVPVQLTDRFSLRDEDISGITRVQEGDQILVPFERVLSDLISISNWTCTLMQGIPQHRDTNISNTTETSLE